MLHLKRVTASTVAAITLALPASAAAQGYQDLRGERARDAAHQAEGRGEPTQDLRNADRRVPDTGVRVPPVEPSVPTVRVVTTESDGFDWGDAGIGAAGGLALITLAGGMAAVATHRRRGAAIG
jgi:hypothetical protein